MTPNRQHIRLRWNPLFIHAIAWTIVFLFPLLFIERVESMRRLHEFSLMKFYIQPICIAVIFYINYLWLIDRVLFRKKPVQFILYNVLLIVVANMAIYLVHRMIIPDEFLFRRPGGPRPPRPWLMQWQDSITLALIVGLSIAIKMTQKWIVTEKERKQLEQERTEAELKNLKNQLNPHFLFNTLNNIYSLIAISPDRAQSAVLELSKMLRYVLYENAQAYVPMEKELEFNHNYIELMRLRLARHVKVEVDMSPLYTGGSAVLKVFRVGYHPDDKADKPLVSFTLPAELVNRKNACQEHNITLYSNLGTTDFYIAGKKIGWCNVNPLGRGGDFIAFPVVGDVGFALENKSDFADASICIRNFRSPENQLTKVHLAGNLP